MSAVSLLTTALLVVHAGCNCPDAPQTDDDYLFAKYLLAAKEDIYGPFGWKDFDAAASKGLSVKAYVIEGVEPKLRERLATMLHALDEEDLPACITSAYRGPERQRMITKGVRASANHSYHGGNPQQRGHGHGLAVDLASCNGETGDQRFNLSVLVWKWIDQNGARFGFGRPYGNHDKPHVAFIEGGEYHARHAKKQKATKNKTQIAKSSKIKHKKSRTA